MDRRYFISRLGRLTAYGSAGGALFPLAGCGGSNNSLPNGGGDVDIPASLAAELAHLVDPEYQAYAGQTAQGSLYQALLDKGVVTASGTFMQQGVAAAAELDPVVEYGGFYHTQTELQVYGLAYSLALNPPVA